MVMIVRHGKPESVLASKTQLNKRDNKALHRTAIPLRSIATAELGR